MSKVYWDVVQWQARPGGKAFPQRLGTALSRDDGGFDIFMNAIPLPSLNKNGDGLDCKLTIMPARERQQGAGAPPARAPRPTPRTRDEMDDEIPF